MLKSSWWQLINSAIIIFLLTTILKTCQKTKDFEVAINNSNTLAIENNNEVKIINQSVTKVEKEIANIHEAIAQIYENVEGKLFLQKDLNKKVRVFDAEERRVVYFQLDKPPIDESVRVTDQNRTYSPMTFSISGNIVALRTNERKENILSEELDFFYIQYSQDYSSEKPLKTLKGMQYKGTKENPNQAILRELSIEKESNAASQSSTND